MIVQTVSTAARVLVDDVGLTRESHDALSSFDALVVGAVNLTDQLVSLLLFPEEAKILKVYVGRSGQIVRAYMEQVKNLPYAHTLSCHAATWDRSGSVPQVTTSSLEYPAFIDTTVDHVVAVDDVVSSGTTLELVLTRNAWRFPKASWHAAAWITRKKKIPEYTSLRAALAITHPEGKRVPINSLSTLQEDAVLAAHYAQKHFGSQEQAFLNTLRTCRPKQ